MAENWRDRADDTQNEICYYFIVQKWAKAESRFREQVSSS